MIKGPGCFIFQSCDLYSDHTVSIALSNCFVGNANFTEMENAIVIQNNWHLRFAINKSDQSIKVNRKIAGEVFC